MYFDKSNATLQKINSQKENLRKEFFLGSDYRGKTIGRTFKLDDHEAWNLLDDQAGDNGGPNGGVTITSKIQFDTMNLKTAAKLEEKKSYILDLMDSNRKSNKFDINKKNYFNQKFCHNKEDVDVKEEDDDGCRKQDKNGKEKNCLNKDNEGIRENGDVNCIENHWQFEEIQCADNNIETKLLNIVKDLIRINLMDSHLARQLDKIMDQTKKMQQRHLSMQSKLEQQQPRCYLTLPSKPSHDSAQEIPSDLQESGSFKQSNVPMITLSPNEDKTDKSSERSSQFLSPFTPLTPISPISPTFTFPTIPQTADIFTKHSFKHSFSVWNNSFYNDDEDDFKCTLKRNHDKQNSSCKYDYKENQKESLVGNYNQNCIQQDEILSEKNVPNVKIFEIEESKKTQTLTKIKPEKMFETNENVETPKNENVPENMMHSNETTTCLTTFDTETVDDDLTTPTKVTNTTDITLPITNTTTAINKTLVNKNNKANITIKNCPENFLHNEGSSNAKFIKEENECSLENSFFDTRPFEVSPIETIKKPNPNNLEEISSLYSSIKKTPEKQYNLIDTSHHTQPTTKNPPTPLSINRIISSTIVTPPTQTPTTSNTKVLIPSIQDSASLQAISVSTEVINHESLTSNPSRATEQHLKNSNIIHATCTYSSVGDRYTRDDYNSRFPETKTLETTNERIDKWTEMTGTPQETTTSTTTTSTTTTSTTKITSTTSTLESPSTSSKKSFINTLSKKNLEKITNSTIKTENKTALERKNIEKTTFSNFLTNIFNSKTKFPDSLDKGTLLSYKNIQPTEAESSLGSKAVERRSLKSQNTASKESSRMSASRIVDAAEIGRKLNSLRNSLKKKSVYIMNSNEDKSEM